MRWLLAAVVGAHLAVTGGPPALADRDAAVAEAGDVEIEILDVRGRRVWTRAFKKLGAGAQVVRADMPLPAGLYFARLRAGREVATRRVVVIP